MDLAITYSIWSAHSDSFIRTGEARIKVLYRRGKRPRIVRGGWRFAAPGNLERDRSTTTGAKRLDGISMKNMNWLALTLAAAFVALVWIPHLFLSR